MERKKELIVSTLNGKVENRYTVSWPTVQQMIDVEALKISISKGKYSDMIMSGTKWSERVLNYIDMCAYLTTLCPKLISDMKVDPRNLEGMDANRGLMKVYQEQFLPWWNEYEDMINKFENPDEEEELHKEDSPNTSDNDQETAS